MAITDTISNWFNFGGLATIVTVFAIVILFVIGAAFFTLWLFMKKLYFKKLIIFEKVGGQIQVTKRDVARDIRLGEAGDFITYTRKYKKFLPQPTIQTGNNTYWYYIREDGEWINIGLGDIDEQMRMANAHFLDKELRFARTGMQKNLKDRFQKVTFWDKYGAMIIWTLYIAIVGVMTWLLFDKWIELSNSVSSAVNTAKEVLELQRETLQNIDNIRSGGTGIIPVE